MTYILINILSVIVGVIIPLIIQKIKGKTSEEFSLRDLSTVLSILIVYYALLFMLYEISFSERAIFYLFILLHIALATTLIAATARFTPLKESIRSLIRFPQIKILSVSNFAILLFFLYTCFVIYSAVEAFAGRLDYLGPANLIFLEAVYNTPFVALPLLILTELFSVAAEEVVCRYFAINALRQKLKKGNCYRDLVRDLDIDALGREYQHIHFRATAGIPLLRNRVSRDLHLSSFHLQCCSADTAFLSLLQTVGNYSDIANSICIGNFRFSDCVVWGSGNLLFKNTE